jgi:hypothetical protein
MGAGEEPWADATAMGVEHRASSLMPATAQ